MATVIRAALLLVAVALITSCAPGEATTPARPSHTTSSGSAAVPAPPAAARPLRVVGLGDSVMAGTHCSCRGLVEEYADKLGAHTHRAVHVDNLGSDGAVAGDVLHDLEQAHLRDLVARADIVVVTVGANDLGPQLRAWRTSDCDDPCFRAPARKMGRTLQRTLHGLAAARGGRSDHVLVTDYWNVFQDGQVALDTDGRAGLAWSARVTDAANDAICRAARAVGAVCVDLVGPFKGSGRDPTPLLADDGDHPNAAGIQVIVRALMSATPQL